MTDALAVLLTAIVVATPASLGTTHAADATDPSASATSARAEGAGAPLALIYRNEPLADKEDAADAAKMLQASPFKFRVQYVGAGELTSELLSKAALFVQPGGEVETETAKRDFAHEIPLVQQFVANGGRYLGICAGGFVAGKEGYGVFPGKVGSYVGSSGAEVKSDKDQAIQIVWRDGRKRTVDFQDGNYFKIPSDTPGVTVMVTYANGLVAAAVASHGRGKSAFVGPHFESAPDDDPQPDHTNVDLSFELLGVLMR